MGPFIGSLTFAMMTHNIRAGLIVLLAVGLLQIEGTQVTDVKAEPRFFTGSSSLVSPLSSATYGPSASAFGSSSTYGAAGASHSLSAAGNSGYGNGGYVLGLGSKSLAASSTSAAYGYGNYGGYGQGYGGQGYGGYGNGGYSSGNYGAGGYGAGNYGGYGSLANGGVSGSTGMGHGVGMFGGGVYGHISASHAPHGGVPTGVFGAGGVVTNGVHHNGFSPVYGSSGGFGATYVRPTPMSHGLVPVPTSSSIGAISLPAGAGVTFGGASNFPTGSDGSLLGLMPKPLPNINRKFTVQQSPQPIFPARVYPVEKPTVVTWPDATPQKYPQFTAGTPSVLTVPQPINFSPGYTSSVKFNTYPSKYPITRPAPGRVQQPGTRYFCPPCGFYPVGTSALKPAYNQAHYSLYRLGPDEEMPVSESFDEAFTPVERAEEVPEEKAEANVDAVEDPDS